MDGRRFLLAAVLAHRTVATIGVVVLGQCGPVLVIEQVCTVVRENLPCPAGLWLYRTLVVLVVIVVFYGK